MANGAEVFERWLRQAREAHPTIKKEVLADCYQQWAERTRIYEKSDSIRNIALGMRE